MRVREAMIVAGGGGTRLRPLTLATPKPLLPFCGAPFLVGVIARLAAVGVERVLLVVGADPAPFRVLDDAARRLGVRLDAVPEPEPLDTAGGVRSALEQMSGTFLVLNGDILTDLDLAALLAAHDAAGAIASIALTRVEDTSSFGVCVRDGSRIVDFVEKPPPGALPGQDTVNAGTYVLSPDALERFAPGRLSFERTVFPALVAAGEHVEGVVSDAVWADLGTPERYLAGHRLALDGALRWPSLDAVPADAGGVRRHPDAVVAAGARIEGPVLLGAGARVEAGAQLGPHVVLGAATVVAEGARVTDSVLFDGARLGVGLVVRQAILGRDVSVSAGARLGERVVVGDGVAVASSAILADDERLPVS